MKAKTRTNRNISAIRDSPQRKLTCFIRGKCDIIRPKQVEPFGKILGKQLFKRMCSW